MTSYSEARRRNVSIQPGVFLHQQISSRVLWKRPIQIHKKLFFLPSRIFDFQRSLLIYFFSIWINGKYPIPVLNLITLVCLITSPWGESLFRFFLSSWNPRNLLIPKYRSEDELSPKETAGMRQSWNVTPSDRPPTPPPHTNARTLSSSGSLSDHYLHNHMLRSEEKSNPQILRVS